jgi:cell division transport system permease protein
MAASKSSLKRGKPNFIYSIIGVALVLFLMGVIGWLFINSKELGTMFKEDVKISVYLRTLNKDTIGQIQQYIATKPFAKDVRYINKEEARKIWNTENNEDWAQILDYNPLPESIDFYTKAAYVNKDSLQMISQTITSVFPNQVSEVNYPPVLVSNIDQVFKKVTIVLLVLSVILGVIVVFLIDNTIRLAMFSNRFLIKTMQMVGATRGFITKPMNIRAIINGLISGVISVILLAVLIFWLENFIEDLKAIRDIKLMIILFISMILLGVLISLYSTHRSVIKYLKMKLDDLY